MLAHEGCEHFDDLWVVGSGVPGDALEGVDTAEADIDRAVAELLDRLREAVGQLAGAVQRERAGRIDRADHRYAACEQRQRRGAHALLRGQAIPRGETIGFGEPLRDSHSTAYARTTKHTTPATAQNTSPCRSHQ